MPVDARVSRLKFPVCAPFSRSPSLFYLLHIIFFLFSLSVLFKALFASLFFCDFMCCSFYKLDIPVPLALSQNHVCNRTSNSFLFLLGLLSVRSK